MPLALSQHLRERTPHRVSPRTPATGAQRSTAERHAIPAAPSAAADANASYPIYASAAWVGFCLVHG